jgi:nucleoside-diphosphate-sugar epimerase
VKIVVTGALGHIGSRVIREIPKAFPEARVVLIDNLLTQRYCSLFNLPAECDYSFIEADVLDADLNSIIMGSDVVLHLAAITDAASSFKNKDQVENVNYNATVKVSGACKDAGVPMIHVSSTSVYGTQREIVDEACSPEELRPQSPYAETKLKEEKFLQGMGHSGELDFVICRFGTICGVSPGIRFHTAVNKFCWQAVMGQALTVWTTALHQKRPYLTLSDAVRALIFIMKKDLFDRTVYNVLTENLTVNAIIGFIAQRVPDLDIEYVDAEIMNQLSYEVSNLRFTKRGFQFEGKVEDSVHKTLDLLEAAASSRSLREEVKEKKMNVGNRQRA